MPSRILLVDHTAKLGGAELSLLKLAESLADACHVVLFDDGPFRHRLQAAGVGVTVLPAPTSIDGVRRDGSLGSAVRAVPALLRQAWALARIGRDYDVLLANSQKSMLVTGLAGLLARRPVAWLLRDLLTTDHFGPLQIRVASAAARLLVARVIANSHASRAALVDAGMPAERVHVVHNGIDPAPFDAVTDADVAVVRRELDLPERGVVGVFSRLSAWKGQHVVLEALRELPDVTALFVGEALFPEDQAYADRLRTDVEAWGLSDRVRMPGFRDDVPALMRACDVVLHTSTAPEPFGRVVVEGMLAGTPVVATREGGPAEIIDDGETGVLLPAGDPHALATAVRRLLDAPDRTATLVAQARAAAARFSPEAMTTQVRAVLDALPRTADRSDAPSDRDDAPPASSPGSDSPTAPSDPSSPSTMTSLLQSVKSLGSERGAFVRNAVPSRVGSILDIGCAFGWDLDALSDRADRLVGVDLDEEALAEARAQYPHLTFLSCSATELPFRDDEFDVVILSEVIEHVGEPNKQPVVDEAHRVLKPGGTLIFTAPFAGATAWADPLDFKRRFPSAYRLYLKASGYEPKTAMDVGHKHVSLPEVETLFGGRFEMETVQFSGFFAPFITWVLTAGERTGLFGNALVKRLNRFRAWEDGVPYPKPLAYNVRLVARKRSSASRPASESATRAAVPA